MNPLPPPATSGAPHLREPTSAPRLLAWFVLASLPVAVAGLWGDPARLITFLTQLALAAATCAFWAWGFARWRGRPPDSAWFTTAWLFTLLLPAATPLVLVAVAASFGVVLGHHVFGGTGRALVNPALLGVLAIVFGYPDLGDTAPVGAASPIASFVGAAVLVRVGAASPRTVAGGVAAVLLVGGLLGTGSETPAVLGDGLHHLMTGSLAFCLSFIATDPSTAALTRSGRWAHGVLAGTFTVLIRVLDPGHPDGALFAVLLAGLAVPLIDHVRVSLWRWRT